MIVCKYRKFVIDDHLRLTNMNIASEYHHKCFFNIQIEKLYIAKYE